MQERNQYRSSLLAHLAKIVLTWGVLAMIIGCGSPGQTTVPPSSTATQPPADTTTPQTPVQVTTQVIATGLQIPWGLTFLPDGKALVSERASGRILTVTATGQAEEVQRLPSSNRGEGGLLGIALSPNYATDGWVYAYYTTQTDNRIVRFRLKETPQLILTGIPAASIHNGGRIAFGPDGMLYAGTGDASVRETAQNKNSLAGKVLRIKPDGGIPTDNPFPNSLVYSYGHRNVQGLAWNAEGQLYTSEFGQNNFDEVNRITPSGNYGWPNAEGEKNDARFINPVAAFTTEEASPSGVTFLKQGAIPQWEGTFFMASLRGQRLWHLTFNADGSLAQREALLEGQFGRLRAVAQAPDGSLWILTSNRDGRGNPVASDDRIVRLGP